jgi:hypothetical protein
MLRLQSFRRSVEDPRLAGQILRRGFGRLVDEHGVDWWDLTSLHIHSEVETAIALRRLADAASLAGELYATRADWPVAGFTALLGRDVRTFGSSPMGRIGGRATRFARAFQRLNRAQLTEIFWDKYDPGYRWLSRLSPAQARSSRPVILVPSAYTNVSRSACKYARFLPERQFLFVATRNSGLQFDPPANGSVAHLAAYGKAGAYKSATTFLQGWSKLQTSLKEIPELALLQRTGQFAPFERWLGAGPAVRDAWLAVLEREPVTAVLCGDDTNWYTRLPVILANRKNIPTVDFHHGAFDGRFLLKDLSSDFYLAKNKMEQDYLIRVCDLPPGRIVVGNLATETSPSRIRDQGNLPNIVFFSEPYESVGGRPEEIYREPLPALSGLSQEYGRTLIVKLHPFESRGERRSLVETALGTDAAKLVKFVDGPLTEDLLSTAWFGITVESSTVLDCSRNGVPCFQCEWLVSTLFSYVEQFDRYGVGQLLRHSSQLADIPHRLAEWRVPVQSPEEASTAAETLRQLFSGRALPVST